MTQNRSKTQDKFVMSVLTRNKMVDINIYFLFLINTHNKSEKFDVAYPSCILLLKYNLYF